MTDDFELLYEDAMTALGEDDVDQAIELMEEMLDVAPDDPHTIEVQGDVARFQDQDQQAEAHYRRLLAEAPNDHWKGVAHFSLGALYEDTAESDQVCQHFEQAIECFQAAGEHFKAAEALTAKAIFDQNQGDFPAAIKSLEAARGLIEAAEDAEELAGEAATVYQLLGTAYRMHGQLDLAKRTLHQALEKFEQLDDPAECADTLDALGVIEQIQGHYEAAEQLHLQALAINEELEYDDGLSVNFGNLTMLNIHRREFDQAADWAHKAYEIDVAEGNDNGVAHFHLLMGEIECERNHLDDAEQHLLKCAELYDQCGDAEDKLCVQGKSAFLYRLRGELDKAAAINQQVLESAKRMEHADGIAATLDELAHVRRAQGRLADARAIWQRALKVYRELDSDKMVNEIAGHLAELP